MDRRVVLLALLLSISLAAPVICETSSASPSPTTTTEPAVEVLLDSVGAKKIQVVKVVRDLTGLGLREAVAIVEGAPHAVKGGLSRRDAELAVQRLQEAGATASFRVDTSSSTPVPGGESPKTSQVFLESVGASKIMVIKIVKDATGLGLKDAKELVESAPVVALKGVTRFDADRIVKELTDVGAKASVR